MNFEKAKQELDENGFTIIHNILSPSKTAKLKKLHDDWRKTIPRHDLLHNSIDPHGIYKFHEAGHQEHAWGTRIDKNVQDAFKYLWKTDELIVSFDGSCYISETTNKTDKIWTHTDQAPNRQKLECYQGFVSFTDNKERTLVVYDKSHKIHKSYFEKKRNTSSKNWQLIDHEFLESIKDSKRVLNIPAGSLVLWDSRTFHQNQYGLPGEERIVQYVCYLPKSHAKNNDAMKKKRMKYFNEKRTTSHWPTPINVNGKQPQTYGDKSRLIDYSKLVSPNLDYIKDEIYKLL